VKAVVRYLISGTPRKENSANVKDLLLKYFSLVTPSTVWLLQQVTFWQLPAQMESLLKTSLTVYDRFEKDLG